MKLTNFFFFLLFLPILVVAEDPANAVTYSLSGGRLGDNLMAYMHAKWVSYKYKLPLVYKPFSSSDQFVFDDVEKKYSDFPKDSFRFTTELKSGVNLDLFVGKGSKQWKNVLFVIPYFPESEWEIKKSYQTRHRFAHFEVNWEDEEFQQMLRYLIAPKIPVKQMHLPKDRISVAVHIRRGGAYDLDNHKIRNEFPLKFLTDDFYIAQLRRMYELVEKKPLYVYLFTDDEDPKAIKTKYENALSDLDIEVDCREEENHWNTNVVEDFFALTQFDCAIHSESNFSMCAGLLTDYKIEIYPTSFRIHRGKGYYDKIKTKIKGFKN